MLDQTRIPDGRSLRGTLIPGQINDSVTDFVLDQRQSGEMA